MDTALDTQPLGTPPGPRGLPLLGSALPFGRDPLGYLLELARHYGDLTRVRLGPAVFYMLNRPELIEDVLVTRRQLFPKEPYAERPHTVETRLLGNGLVTSEGEFWLRQRRLAQPAFHRARIEGYAATMVQLGQAMLARWQDAQTLDVHAEMMRVTLEIVAQTLLGADVSSDASEVGLAVKDALDVGAEQMTNPVPIPHWLPTPGNRRFTAAVLRLRGVIERIVSERRSSGVERDDLLGMLLAARDDDGMPMSERQLRDEVVTMFLAGHETTAVALTNALRLLAERPEIEAQLHAELDSVLGGRAPGYHDLPQLPVANAIVRETLRLYPPVWGLSGRVAAQAVELGGYALPKGAYLFISQWVTQRDERWWPNADRFMPERWLDGSAERVHRFAYFPFGGGPRLCIGAGFAMLEGPLLLALLAQRFRLRAVAGARFELQPSLTLRPKHAVMMKLHQR